MDEPSDNPALRGSVAPQATTHSSQPDLTDPPTLVQKLTAEAIGTFAFVLVGCGALTAAVLQTIDSFGDSEFAPDAADFLYRSSPAFGLFFGLVLIGVGFTFARVSGGHANPAVTLASAAAGRLAWIEALAYVGAQLAGAVLGGATVLLLATGFDLFDPFDVPLGASGWGDASTGYAWWAALLLEVVLTAILALVFLGVHDRRIPRRDTAPVVVGLTFAGLYFLSLPAVNGGLHPAKAIGSALFSGGDALGALWVFVIGPVVGALVAGLVYPLVFGRDGVPVPGSGLVAGRRTPATGYGAYPQPWDQSAGYGQPVAPGGYAQPGQPGGYPPPAASTPAGGYGQEPYQQPEPIIQNGWQWDPHAQQWIPAQQPGQQGWGDQGGGQTRIRPQDGG